MYIAIHPVVEVPNKYSTRSLNPNQGILSNDGDI